MFLGFAKLKEPEVEINCCFTTSNVSPLYIKVHLGAGHFENTIFFTFAVCFLARTPNSQK